MDLLKSEPDIQFTQWSAIHPGDLEEPEIIQEVVRRNIATAEFTLRLGHILEPRIPLDLREIDHKNSPRL